MLVIANDVVVAFTRVELPVTESVGVVRRPVEEMVVVPVPPIAN